jgi:hypothetical protein
MKKQLLITSCILVLIILGIIIVKKINHQNSATQVVTTSNVPTPVGTVEQLIIPGSYDIKTVTKETDYATIDIKYPSFKLAPSQFNDAIATNITNAIDNHIKIAEENWKARVDTKMPGDTITEKPSTKEDKLSLQIDVTIIQSNDNYISYLVTQSGYEGGAHGYSLTTSGAYDVKNKKEIILEDLFSNDSDYLNKISLSARAELIKEYATLSDEDRVGPTKEAIKEYAQNIQDMINDGTVPDIKNFETFTFTSDIVTIYFQQYQVGPYSIGMPTVSISRN